MKSVHIQSIPHEDHRFPTCGDYFENSPGNWVILVSETGDWRMNMLIAFHELAELIQVEHEGIEEPDILMFDEDFEKRHADDDSEPGDDPAAPYHTQHVFAECLERLLAQRLGVSWEMYYQKLMKLWRPKGKTCQ